MASSQKPKTHSASRSAAAWAGASEGDAALGKPVAVQDADASLGLPIAVVNAGEEMPPTFSPGPAGDVVDLTPELAQKMRAETDQVQSAEATGLQLPRPVSPPVGQTSPPEERALPPVEWGPVSNAPMTSYIQLANRVQPPQPLSQGRLHPDVSEDHPQSPRPEPSSHAWEPALTDRRPAWAARAGVSIPQVAHSSEATCEVAQPSLRQLPRSISVMTARNQPRALPDYTSQGVGRSLSTFSHPRVQLPTFKGSGEWKVFWLQFRRAARQYSWDPEVTLDHLVTSLRDDALQFYAELPEKIQADLDFTIAAFGRRFNNHGLPETYRASLQGLKKTPRESLEEYASRVHRTVTKAYPGTAGSQLAEDLTIENLVGGLADSNLIYDVLTKKPRSVQEAIDLIQWHESCKGAQKRKVAFKQVSVDTSVDDGVGSVRRVDSKHYVTEERLTQFSHDFKNDVVKELKKFCQPNRGQGSNNGGRQQRRDAGRRENIECYSCHEMGHFARECPLRDRVENRTPETSGRQQSYSQEEQSSN